MNWLAALRTVLDEYKSARLQWGVHDCCQFASRYVELVTGTAHAALFGAYDEAQANALMQSHGGLSGLVSNCLGQPKENAEKGDVVVCDIGSGVQTVGIFNGEYVLCFHHDEGLAKVSKRRVTGAWRVV